jgi:hypothetical protein
MILLCTSMFCKIIFQSKTFSRLHDLLSPWPVTKLKSRVDVSCDVSNLVLRLLSLILGGRPQEDPGYEDVMFPGKTRNVYYLTNIKHFPCWYTVISTRVELGKREIVWKHDARRAECFHTISSFPNFHEWWYNYISIRKNVLYFFYNIAMSKARRIRKISVFTSGGKFPVLTLSYINTAVSQSAFRIYKCYIIITII